MEILTFECGPLYTNTYVVGRPETGKAVLIDCPPDTLQSLKANNVLEKYTIEHVLITHAHWDHTGGAKELKEALGAKIHVHEDDKAGLADPGLLIGHAVPEIQGCDADGEIEDSTSVSFSGMQFDVLGVPGHTKGHIALYCKEARALFAGDVLFLGSIGRTDLPGGDYDTLMESIRTRILALPDDTMVYPGHGPKTLLGNERNTNPFILDYLSHFT